MNATVRQAARPMLLLAAGLTASEIYLYSAALLGRGPATQPLPVPLYIPQAVMLPILLLSPRRYWWLLLGEYYAEMAVHTIVVRGFLPWQLTLGTAGATLAERSGSRPARLLVVDDDAD